MNAEKGYKMFSNKEAKLKRMEQTEGTILTENKYNLAIGLTILWGILINIGMAVFLAPYIIKIDPRIAILGYVVVSIGCMAVVMKSRKPAFSFLGFTGLAAAMGFALTIIVSAYSLATIYSAFLTTGIIVVSMMIVSTIFPKFFLSLGRTLLFALIGSILIEFIGGLIFHLPLQIMDYVIVVIFAGYIGYDWAKAQAYPKTLHNAVNSAADIYVDIINIFIRLLSIMGKDSN